MRLLKTYSDKNITKRKSHSDGNTKVKQKIVLIIQIYVMTPAF